MNDKGFNLFTALISFLLILLAVLLVQSMIQSERNATDTVDHIESRSKLEATAEMARADAMQVFNYALRKKIEDWLVSPETGVVFLRLEDKSWQEIQDEFAESKFGGNQGSQFAHFTAGSLEAIFHQPTHFGNYTISIEGKETLADGIKNAISKSLEDDFFTVIECNGDPRGNNCPLGTFYVNLHLERLSQEEYESLPKIVVRDKASGEELKQVILPKTTFRIYVPLRFFKAIAEARSLAHYSNSGKSFSNEGWINTPDDYGLFAPRTHNIIEQFALGMCDYGTCRPREDPLNPMAVGTGFPAEEGGTNLFCPGDNTAPTWSTTDITTKITPRYDWYADGDVPETYNANNNQGWEKMQTALGDIAEARVCAVVKGAKDAGYLDDVEDDNFAMVGEECGEDGEELAFDIAINVQTRESKLIGGVKGDGSQAPNIGRNIGLFGTVNNVQYPAITNTAMACSSNQGDYKSRCAEVNSVKVVLAFEEKDPNYMVRQPKPGRERLYRIAIYDNTYKPFTANWQQGNLGANFLYNMEPQETRCSMQPGAGWYCTTTGEPGPIGRPMTSGCTPA